MGKAFYISLISIVVAVISVFFLQCVIIRILKKIKKTFSNQILLILIVTCCSIFQMICLLFYISDFSVKTKIYTLIYSLTGYFAIAYAYFQFFNMSETARRIKIVTRIYKNPDIKVYELKKVYNPELQILKRIERLKEMSQITLKENRYYIKNRFFLIPAIIINFWRKTLLKIDKG